MAKDIKKDKKWEEREGGWETAALYESRERRRRKGGWREVNEVRGESSGWGYGNDNDDDDIHWRGPVQPGLSHHSPRNLLASLSLCLPLCSRRHILTNT